MRNRKRTPAEEAKSEDSENEDVGTEGNINTPNTNETSTLTGGHIEQVRGDSHDGDDDEPLDPDLEDGNTSTATSDVNPLDDGDIEDSPVVHNDENSSDSEGEHIPVVHNDESFSASEDGNTSAAASDVNPLDEGDLESDVEDVE